MAGRKRSPPGESGLATLAVVVALAAWLLARGWRPAPVPVAVPVG